MTQKTFEELAFRNRRGDHLYFTMIPNVVWFLDLSPFDFKLYNTIVKTTGPDGRSPCFKTTETLAKETRMSVGSVSKAKVNLARAGLIEIKTKKRCKSGRPVDHIEIMDVWEENMQFFKRVYSSGEEIPVFSSLGELRAWVFSRGSAVSSPGEPEEEPLNKNQEMNKIVNLPDFFSGSAEDIWNEAKAQLKLSMTKATFDTWLANSCGLSFDDHVLVVGVSNPYAQDWCTSRLMKIVERAVEAVMGEKVEVRFKVRHHENLSEKES